MEIYEVRQNAVTKKSYHKQTLHIYSLKLPFFNEIANYKTNSYAWNVAADPVEKLHCLSPNYFSVNFYSVFFVYDFTAYACVTIGNSGHVYVAINISSDKFA